MRDESTPTTIRCKHCGKECSARHTGGQRIYCSRQCVWAAKRIPIEDRFWSKVDRSGGEDACWEWQGNRHVSGYGSVRHNGRVEKAHRVAYELMYGPIPEGHYVCHHCDNPPCVNPAHLFAGTPAENSQDRERKGRREPARGSRSGMSKLTEFDVADILRRLQRGEKQKPIAALYGVDFTLISMIKRNKIWRHVPRPK